MVDATASAASSTASTDNPGALYRFAEPEPTPPQPPRPVVMADPKDFRDAVRTAADMVFVLSGQAVGSLHSRRTGEERDAQRWKPTALERKRVADPAHRIARRHIVNSVETADAVDGCLLAAAVGAFVERAVFDLDEMEPLPDA